MNRKYQFYALTFGFLAIAQAGWVPSVSRGADENKPAAESANPAARWS